MKGKLLKLRNIVVKRDKTDMMVKPKGIRHERYGGERDIRYGFKTQVGTSTS